MTTVENRNKTKAHSCITEEPGPPKISKMESFATTVNVFLSLTIIANLSVLNVIKGPEWPLTM